MTKLTKNKKAAFEKLDRSKLYTLIDGAKLVKDISFAKFDESVELAIRLGVDPRKPNQMVRGTVALPHGTGKEIKVLVLCNPDKNQEAVDAGADYVGLDEYVEKIQNGWVDMDAVITQPSIMPKVGKLGKVLGPRGLMPNPKSGTVTDDIGTTVKDIKQGKIDFKVDKYGIVHSSVGKVSFEPQQIVDNVKEMVSTIRKLKPASSKGTYIKSIYLASTMSPGIRIDSKSIEEKI
jgi:large subunit ribosomal protein L1